MAREIDVEKIDEAVLALLCLTLHDQNRAWKSFDWNAMNRLHEKGFICNPVGKAKSVVFTDEGLRGGGSNWLRPVVEAASGVPFKKIHQLIKPTTGSGKLTGSLTSSSPGPCSPKHVPRT